jgi:WD40 repeat protein
VKFAFVFGMSAVLLVGAGPSGLAQTAVDRDETSILQQRLTEAGCYKGPIDGRPSPLLERARKACPDQSPKLRIETGTHLAWIRTVSVDRRCTRAVTGSVDKTIRQWSLPDGRLLRTIRPPIGDGEEGKVYAAALSPDGNWIAAGGWDPHNRVDKRHGITLFSLNGAAPRRLGALPSVINNLAFSPDGRRLAVAARGGSGLRVFDLDGGKETDLSAGYTKDTNGLAFASDGSIYTSSDDGFIRYYDAHFQIKKMIKARGQTPSGLALSPDGQRLAVGYVNEARVDLYAAASLNALPSLDVSGIDNGDLATVAWTADGSVHAAGAADIYMEGKRLAVLRSWDPKGNVQKPDRTISTTNETIFDLHPCGDGLTYASGDGGFGLIGLQGPAQQLSISVAADLRGNLNSKFQVSADGRQVYFGLRYGSTQPVLFDMAKAVLSEAPQQPKGLFSALTEGLKVANWEDRDKPTFSGRLLPFADDERSRSLAIRHDRKGFILGTNQGFRAYDAKGSERLDAPYKSAPEDVWGVNLTPDDRILVAAVGDGTIRWYRTDDLIELLALFVDVRDRRWIAWTPSGYYMASAGGEDLIGWHFNRGWAQEAAFYPAAQFRDRFSRPDIVQLVLQTLDEGKAVAEADAVRARSQQPARKPQPSPPSETFAAALPPQVVILSPKDGDRFSTESIDVSFQLRSPLGHPITQLQWQVDANPARTLKVRLGDGDEDIRTIPLPRQNVTVSLSAATGSLNSDPARIRLIYEGAKPAQAPKPNLYLLAIGVDDYEKADEFPQTHAEAGIDSMIETWKKQEGRQFGKVIPLRLFDGVKSREPVTFERIREAFDRLAEAQDNDLVVVYLVGHGFVDATQNFHFMLRRADISRLRTTSLSRADILDPLLEIRGRKLVLIESCHAASVTEQSSGAARYNMNNVMNEFRDRVQSPFFVVIGAAQAFQMARFEQRWGYRGAFTQALVDALEGKAADKEGRIGVLSLFRYLNEQIPSMTTNNQKPSIVPPVMEISDFPLASIR